MAALSNQARAEIITVLNEIDASKLAEALMAATTAEQIFPSSMETLTYLQKALLREKNNEILTNSFKSSISIYLKEKGCDDFKQSLTEPDQLNNELLIFLAEKLEIKFNATPIVRVAIHHGKILWRVVTNHKTVFERPHFKDINEVTILDDKQQYWEMSWEQFRQFRDSGKRSSSVAVTQDRFVQSFPKNQKENAKTVWRSLLKQGVLTEKYKISPAFYALQNEYILIPHSKDISYGKIVNVIESIQNNTNNKDVINLENNLHTFRANSIGKEWQSTGRIINKKFKHLTLKWHVGTHDELTAHRDDNEEALYGEILNYDHIPSEDALRQKTEDKDVGKASLTIAILQSLHRQGITYLASRKKQAINSENPFLRDVAEYARILQRDNLSPQEQLLAFGAFRYLYHCHTKTPASIKSSKTHSRINITTTVRPISDAALSFFNDKNKKEIDAFFTQEMQRITKLL